MMDVVQSLPSGLHVVAVVVLGVVVGVVVVAGVLVVVVPLVVAGVVVAPYVAAYCLAHVPTLHRIGQRCFTTGINRFEQKDSSDFKQPVWSGLHVAVLLVVVVAGVDVGVVVVVAAVVVPYLPA